MRGHVGVILAIAGLLIAVTVAFIVSSVLGLLNGKSVDANPPIIGTDRSSSVPRLVLKLTTVPSVTGLLPASVTYAIIVEPPAPAFTGQTKSFFFDT